MAPRRSRAAVAPPAQAAGDLAIDAEGLSADELARLLDARDRVLARRGLDGREDERARRSVLLAQVGAVRIAVPLEAVAAVLPPVRVSVVPGAPGQLMGLFLHDGAIHNLFAVEGALGLPPAAPRAEAAALVLRRAGPRIAIAIDEAIDVVRVVSQGAETGSDGSPLRFVAGEGEEPVAIVDVERLFVALDLRGSHGVEGETN